MHVIVWEFVPMAGKEREFERAYGLQGDWALLFAKSQQYRGTELLRPLERRIYLTIDRWTSAAAFEAFRRQWQAEYDALDRRCEAVTERETLVGQFETV